MDDDFEDAELVDVTQPLFREPSPDEPDEDWALFVLGGMAQRNELEVARSYRMATDALIARALRASDLSYEYAFPVLYLYRHVIELYLKLIVQPQGTQGHGIMPLARAFKARVHSKLKLKIPNWVMDRFRELSEMDPHSDAFRFTKDRKGKRRWMPGEYTVSYRQVRLTMDVLVKGFEQAYFALPGKKS